MSEYTRISREEFDARSAAIRAKALAVAWDEGLDAGRYRWMDGWEFGDKPVNPYRGADNE